MRDGLPDLSRLCHVCGSPATRWIKTDPQGGPDPHCPEHAELALDSEERTKRFHANLETVARDPWWVERWYRCDLPRVELAEASDRLLVVDSLERIGWKGWSVYTIVYVKPHKPSYAAELVGVDRRTVWRWRKEYQKGGLGKLIR